MIDFSCINGVVVTSFYTRINHESLTLAEKLLQDFQDLPEDKKKQVVDFVEFLKKKQHKEMEAMMDDIIETNKEALVELAK
jgi:hypothetical protein